MNQADTVDVPLVVDLDGTLLRTDLLHESTLLLLGNEPLSVMQLPVWLASGKAHLKREIAQRVTLDFEEMPYHKELVEWLRSERRRGRHIVLSTASDVTLAQGVAEHLGVFDEVLASDGVINNSAHRKAAALVRRFGERGFDYVGNSSDDLPVWDRARHAIVASASPELRRKAAQRSEIEREFPSAWGGARTWVKALRLHQWMKNFLLFVPLLGAHQIFNAPLVLKEVMAFFAFGLCASAVYVINDLIDLESDRHHPRKRSRPFASGDLAPLQGLGAAALLLLSSAVFSLAVNFAFLGWLSVYFGLTLAYTFLLKHREIVDTLTLAALYTLRIIAGGAAVALEPSFWLLAFSLFFFLSLALVKRYSELQLMLGHGRDEAQGRAYRTVDLQLIQTMGIVAGFAAVMVLALYINGGSVVLLYQRPQVMWLTVPILLFWIMRVWIKAHRGLMHDDPVVFATTDKASLISGALFLGVLWLAT